MMHRKVRTAQAFQHSAKLKKGRAIQRNHLDLCQGLRLGSLLAFDMQQMHLAAFPPNQNMDSVAT